MAGPQFDQAMVKDAQPHIRPAGYGDCRRLRKTRESRVNASTAVQKGASWHPAEVQPHDYRIDLRGGLRFRAAEHEEPLTEAELFAAYGVDYEAKEAPDA